MSTKYPQGIITATPPFKATSGQNYSGVWTLEQLAKNFYYYGTAVPNSIRFRSSASAYLNRTPASAGNRQKFTWSAWLKRGALGANYTHFFGSGTLGGVGDDIGFNGDKLDFYLNDATDGRITSTAVYRDPSAWYHVVFALDTTQATASNRMKMYVNGTQVTSLSVASYPTQNYQCSYFNTASPQYIGNGYAIFDGYMAEINFIDGQALTPSSFGVTSPITGVWCPIKYTGTYGTNGFHLDFSNGTSTTTLGYDSSGNSNNWTTNNISLTAGSTYDWMIDSPTSYAGSSYGVGNYAVLNPLDGDTNGSINSGNLVLTQNGGGGSSGANSTIGVSSGKWFFEVTVTALGSNNMWVGVRQNLTRANDNFYSQSWNYNKNGQACNASPTGSAYGATYTTGDVIGCAVDADAGTIVFYKNGTSQGTAFSGLTMSGGVKFGAGGDANNIFAINFGQRPFAYTPPSGFKSLCTYNLPQPTIAQGNKFMDATLYTGNGSTQSIVNAGGFQPDFVWYKNRSTSASHNLFDSIRGANQYLISNDTSAEGTASGVTAFNSNGFSVGSLSNGNGSGNAIVAWQWKASNAAAVTNTAGSITSQVSANTTAGFSVVTFTSPSSFTNATVGHGLGVAPSMIITKSRTSTGGWVVWHTSLGVNGYLSLDSTSAAGTNSQAYNGTSSTTFTMGSNAWWQAAAQNWVSYCFAAIPGYSAFGSYTGNGSSDGPFVYCGFRPRYVLIKRTDSAVDWMLFDTSRSPYNVAMAQLNPNTSAAEDSSYQWLDILSNGFKLRNGALLAVNASGGTYIYAAFAESPFNYALAR